jgi:hypothetical protein
VPYLALSKALFIHLPACINYQRVFPLGRAVMRFSNVLTGNVYTMYTVHFRGCPSNVDGARDLGIYTGLRIAN